MSLPPPKINSAEVKKLPAVISVTKIETKPVIVKGMTIKNSR